VLPLTRPVKAPIAAQGSTQPVLTVSIRRLQATDRGAIETPSRRPQRAESLAIPPSSVLYGSRWGRPRKPLIVDLLAHPLAHPFWGNRGGHSRSRISRHHELRESVNQREKLTEPRLGKRPRAPLVVVDQLIIWLERCPVRSETPGFALAVGQPATSPRPAAICQTSASRWSRPLSSHAQERHGLEIGARCNNRAPGPLGGKRGQCRYTPPANCPARESIMPRRLGARILIVRAYWFGSARSRADVSSLRRHVLATTEPARRM